MKNMQRLTFVVGVTFGIVTALLTLLLLLIQPQQTSASQRRPDIAGETEPALTGLLAQTQAITNMPPQPIVTLQRQPDSPSETGPALPGLPARTPAIVDGLLFIPKPLPRSPAMDSPPVRQIPLEFFQLPPPLSFPHLPASTQSEGLILQINYGHDWVQGTYEPGHIVWLTVTNNIGEIKATAQLSTGPTPWGWDGFATHVGDNPWRPQRPNIQPGDFVHGAVSTGYTATVQVGQITGFVDVDADTITGTVSAPWLMPGPVNIHCHTWGAPGGAPHKWDTVIPDGSDTYACAWDPDTEWDVWPGQEIADPCCEF